MTRLISIAVLLALSGLAALAGAPTAQIRVTTDKLLSVLKDEALAKEEKLEVKRDKMTEIISDHFDWKLISPGCLGRHWRKLSEKERQSFETKFKGLLQRTYLTQLETYFTDLESINYRSERIQGNYVSVKTVFSTKKNTKHPVEYRVQSLVS
jgi:phospholipid transport system substrate-binding protein